MLPHVHWPVLHSGPALHSCCTITGLTSPIGGYLGSFYNSKIIALSIFAHLYTQGQVNYVFCSVDKHTVKMLTDVAK